MTHILQYNQFKNPVPTVGTDGEFATLEAVLLATTPPTSVVFVSDIAETGTFVSMAFGLALTVNTNGFTWNSANLQISPNGSNVLRFIGGGKWTTLLTGVETFTFSNFDADTTIDLTGFRLYDGTANTANKTGIITGGSAEQVLVNNTTFLLHNGEECGFLFTGDEGLFSELTLVGGGSSCSGFIKAPAAGIISNVLMRGVFNASQSLPIIDIEVSKTIVDNIDNTGTATWLRFRGDDHKISSINGNLNIDMTASKDCAISDITVGSLDLSDVACNNNDFKGVAVTTNVVIGGDGNRGVACRFAGTVTINGDNNHFSLSTAASVIDNGTGNFFTNTAAAGGVASVFTRTGAVVAATSDYDASQIDNDSSVSGATVKDALNNLEAGGALQQTRAFWQGLAGDNANSGKSEDTPKLTVAAMVTAVGTPTAALPATMTMIGGQVNTESFSIPAFTTLIAPNCEFQGAITMNDGSKLIANKVRGKASTISISAVGPITCFIELNELSDQAATIDQVLIGAGLASIVHAKIGLVSSLGTGISQPWDILTAATLILNMQSFKGINSGITAGGGQVFSNIMDGDVSGDSIWRNDSGGFAFDIAGNFALTRNGVVDFSVSDAGTFVQRIFTDEGIETNILSGNTAVINATFSPATGQYILAYNESGNTIFRNYTIFSVVSNAVFILDEVVSPPTTTWTAVQNGANIRLEIDNNSAFTLTFHWSILRIGD